MLFSFAERSLDPKDAIELLIKYYPRETVRHYDLGPASRPDEVTVTDLGRLVVIEVALEHDAELWMIRQGRSAPWHLVSMQDRLVDILKDEHLYERAVSLYNHFRLTQDRSQRISGAGDAKQSKLLHMKRPAFFPILDSKMRSFYEHPARQAFRDSSQGFKETHPDYSHLYWTAIATDLADQSNAEAFKELRQGLTTRVDGGGEDAGFSAQLLMLNNLRLHDTLVWLLATS